MRRPFTLIRLFSLLSCIASAALWIHGRGRIAGWRFAPSPAFVIPLPDGSAGPDWCVRWMVQWDSNGELTAYRSLEETRWVVRKPAEYFSLRRPPTPWRSLPRPAPRGSAFGRTKIVAGGDIKSYLPTQRGKPTTRFAFGGFAYTDVPQEYLIDVGGRATGLSGERKFVVSLARLFWITSVFPLIWIAVAWRARRRKRLDGGCQSCGYDLTANYSGVCPECGTPVPSKPEPVT